MIFAIIEQLDLTIFFQFVNCETDSSDLKIRLDEPHYKITKLLQKIITLMNYIYYYYN